MTRGEFLEQVLAPLGRLTAEERENVRRELEEHVEDRMEALLDMGWDAELAESRCLEAMGTRRRSAGSWQSSTGEGAGCGLAGRRWR